MQLRLTLAAVIVAASALCGRAASDAARQRVKALRLLRDDLRGLRVQMVSMFQPVQVSLSHAASPILRRVAEGMAGGAGAGEVWRRLGRVPGRLAPLAPEDREALGELFEELGETGRGRQDVLIAGATERLDALLAGATERARRAERLYGALGMLLGLLAAVLVI